MRRINENTLLTDNKEVSSIISGVESMDIPHLNDVKSDFVGYIRYLTHQETDDLYCNYINLVTFYLLL